jgi:hypothetical protein
MDSFTLTDAIARLAYGADYDGRYNGPGGRAWTESDARALRRRDMRNPGNSKLPGTFALIGQSTPAASAEALTAWKETDGRRWRAVEEELLAELAAGDAYVFNETGKDPTAEFWLSNTLRSRRACRFRVPAAVVDRLLRRRARNARVDDETKREKLIEKFAEEQRQRRAWINFADMADWCAREGGSIQPNGQLRNDAYRQLGEAVARGEFEVDSRTRVLFLNPAAQWFKMTRERLAACPYDLRDDWRGVSDLKVTYLACCWIPRELSARWFTARRIQLPPWVAGGERDVPAQKTPVVTSDSRRSARLGTDKPPVVAQASLTRWYVDRKNSWRIDRKHPSEADDLVEARDHFKGHTVSREAVRVVRAGFAPKEWKAHGRRKRARE